MVYPVEDFPHLPLETQMYTLYGPTFAGLPHSSSQLGGKNKFTVTPQMTAAVGCYSDVWNLMSIH